MGKVTIKYYPLVKLGWQCPYCKTVYSPDIEKCECCVRGYTTVPYETWTDGYELKIDYPLYTSGHIDGLR